MKINLSVIQQQQKEDVKTKKWGSESVGVKEQELIGMDLWKQMKRISIPIFDGNKSTYESWKAAFTACIDQAPATPEYKLLQLRQHLTGEALKCIENLGHSAGAYEASKNRLERKFGGLRRRLALYIEQLEGFRSIQYNNAKDLEQVADLLDVAIINLRESRQYHELGTGSLYVKLQRKLPEMMLASYHRWIFENNHLESVETLRDWLVQEAEFQTIAAETIKGIMNQKKISIVMDHSFQIRRLPVLGDAKFVMENMVYGHVKCFKEWISIINGMLLRKRNFAFVAWVMIIIQKIAKEEENVKCKIVTRSITSYCVFRRKMIQQKEVETEQVHKMLLDQTK